MGESTSIAWCDHTFNPWHGCARVSPGCEHCYAESFSARIGHGTRLPTIWGVHAERKFFGDKHWNEPLKWQRNALRDGIRRRVFCASMADVFEDRRDLDEWRHRLWTLIDQTPSLIWLLLTKRPENVAELAPPAWVLDTWPSDVWLGTTAEDQRRLDERWPHLDSLNAPIKFLSCEPLLGDLLLPRGPSWVIVGGEAGPSARPFDLGWARSIVAQSRRIGAAPFVKQLGSNPHGEWGDTNTPKVHVTEIGGESRIEENRYKNGRWRLQDRKGESWSEWPSDLRVREFPEVQS